MLQVSVAVLLDNFLLASKEIQMEEESQLFLARRKAAPVEPFDELEGTTPGVKVIFVKT